MNNELYVLNENENENNEEINYACDLNIFDPRVWDNLDLEIDRFILVGKVHKIEANLNLSLDKKSRHFSYTFMFKCCQMMRFIIENG